MISGSRNGSTNGYRKPSRYSAFGLIRHGLSGSDWSRAWYEHDLKPGYDVLVIGGGVHGLALAPGGVAYIMQLSILSQQRTAELLQDFGFEARVVDFGFFEFTEVFREREEQIGRVESLSDAYHLKLGNKDVMVAYVLEVTRKKRKW